MGKSVFNTVRVYNPHPLALDFHYLNQCIPTILKHFHSFKHTIATRWVRIRYQLQHWFLKD